ncbi:MAG: hypothetical protein AAF637_18750 [Pseudomonadota bacterium]
MQPSLTPALLAIELGFLFALAWRSRHHTHHPMAAVFVYLGWVTAYAIATAMVGARGAFVADDLMPYLPGLWLQLITVAAFVVPVILFVPVRDGLRQIVDVTPRHWFAYFQALRITALGTAYKTWIGAFPASFELVVGVPDLLFGLSAFWIAGKAKAGALSDRAFLIWNLIGALIIVPAAPIMLQLGLPGPLQVFTSLPDARAVYTFPMSIASMVGVPLFVMVNLLVAWRLWEREIGPATRQPPTVAV